MEEKADLTGRAAVAPHDSSEDTSLFDFSAGMDAADVLASLSHEEVNFECPAYNTRKASFSLYDEDTFEYDDKPGSPAKSPRKTTKVGWTKDECDKLRALVEGYANKRKISWIEIAKHFHGKRNAKRCREKWVEYLDPQLSGAPFTAQDDAFILKCQASMGNRWRDIAQMMKNRRSATAVKVRWHQLHDRGQHLSIPLKEVVVARTEEECVTDRSGASGASSSMSLVTESSTPSTESTVDAGETIEEMRSKQLVWAMPPPKRQKKTSPPTLLSPNKRARIESPVVMDTPSHLPAMSAPLPVTLPTPLLSPPTYPTSTAPMMAHMWQSFVNQSQMRAPSQSMSMYPMNYMPMMLYPQPNNYADVSSMYPILMQQPVYYGCAKCGPNIVCRGHAHQRDSPNQQLPNH